MFQPFLKLDVAERLTPKTLSPSDLLVSRFPLKILVSNEVVSYFFLMFN